MSRTMLPIAALVVAGCYGGNHLDLELGAGAVCGPDSPRALFFAFTKAYRPARGLARFPDGGSPRSLRANLSLYELDTQSARLSRVHDFGELPHAGRSVWETEVHRHGAEVRFRVTPVGGWTAAMAHRPLIDAALMSRLKDWFVLDTASAAVTRKASVDSFPARRSPCSITEVSRLTRDVSWSAWGVDLDRVFPATREARIKDLEELQGNQAYRNAVIERLAGDLDDGAVRRIIARIEAHARRQPSHVRMGSAGARAETIARLRAGTKAGR